MKEKTEETIWDWILAAFGITATGFFFGLHRFLWRLWIVLSGIWVIGMLLLGLNLEHTEHTRVISDPLYWLFIFVPPILLLGIAVLLNWIIQGLREDIWRTSKSDDTRMNDEKTH